MIVGSMGSTWEADFTLLPISRAAEMLLFLLFLGRWEGEYTSRKTRVGIPLDKKRGKAGEVSPYIKRTDLGALLPIAKIGVFSLIRQWVRYGKHLPPIFPSIGPTGSLSHLGSPSPTPIKLAGNNYG